MQRLIVSCVYSWTRPVNVFTVVSFTVAVYGATGDFWCSTTGDHQDTPAPYLNTSASRMIL